MPPFLVFLSEKFLHLDWSPGGLFLTTDPGKAASKQTPALKTPRWKKCGMQDSPLIAELEEKQHRELSKPPLIYRLGHSAKLN